MRCIALLSPTTNHRSLGKERRGERGDRRGERREEMGDGR